MLISRSNCTGLFPTAFLVLLAIASPPVSAGQPEIAARDPDGCGMLCRLDGKRLLIVSGTPEEMGTAHGRLLREEVRQTLERVVYLVGGASTVQSGKWFFDEMAEIERRTAPHLPERFLRECDAMAAAAGARAATAAMAICFRKIPLLGRGRARQGQHRWAGCPRPRARLHAHIGLQETAVIGVFIPDGRHAWMTLGYAGFIGTVTAINRRAWPSARWAAAARDNGTACR